MTKTEIPADPTAATPTQIDARLYDLYRDELRVESHIRGALSTLRLMLGQKEQRVSRNRLEWPTSDVAALTEAARRAGEHSVSYGRTIGDQLARYNQAVAALNATLAKQAPLNDEFDRRGGWTRFYVVAGGHIHKSMHCSTCNKGESRTEFGWIPEMSGRDESEALAELASRAHILCTVCFPNAPVLPAAPRKSAAEKAADRAAAEQKARVEEPKLIAAPDGSPLRVGGDTVRTVRSAEIKAVDALWWAAFGRHVNEPNEPYAQKYEGHARQLAAALAHKRGTTVAAELATTTEKAVKKLRKEMGADVADAATTVWAAQAVQAAGPVHERTTDRPGPAVPEVSYDQVLRDHRTALAALRGRADQVAAVQRHLAAALAAAEGLDQGRDELVRVAVALVDGMEASRFDGPSLAGAVDAARAFTASHVADVQEAIEGAADMIGAESARICGALSEAGASLAHLERTYGAAAEVVQSTGIDARALGGS